jgi:hypothetical protein
LNAIVTGSISLSNGQIPTTVSWHSEGIAELSGKKFRFVLNVVDGRIVLEFEKLDETDFRDVDELLRLSRHVVDGAIAERVIAEGIGLVYFLADCRTFEGALVPATPDRAPGSASSAINSQKLQVRLGESDGLVRFAFRDFNQGLVDRENCPFLFYRMIETLAKKVTDSDELSDSDWTRYHSLIGTRRDEMLRIEGFAGRHRHGSHKNFMRDDHLEMMREAWRFLQKSLEYLTSN